MSKTKATPWIAATAFLCLIILALAWFLAISPQLTAAADARSELQTVEAQNVIHAQRLATLESQAAELDTYRAELAELAVGIPPEVQIDDVLRSVASIAASAGVTVLMTEQGVPELVVGPVATSEPAPADEDADAEGTDDAGDTDETAAPSGVVTGVDGLVAIPVSLTVLGGYDAAVTFVEQLQTGIPRLFLVTDYVLTGQPEAEGSDGRPATVEGDIEALVNGFVYVLAEVASDGTVGPVEAPVDAPADGDVDM